MTQCALQNPSHQAKRSQKLSVCHISNTLYTLRQIYSSFLSLKKKSQAKNATELQMDGEMKSHRKAYAHTEYRLGTTNTLTYNGFTVQKDRAFYWLFRNLLRWVFHSPSSRLHRNVEYNTRTSNVTPVRASTNTCGDSIFWTRFSTYIVPLNSPLTQLLHIYINKYEYISLSIYTYIFMYVYIYILMYMIYLDVFAICIFICMYIFTCIYIYV